jgi:hypothetical protein
LLFNLIRVPGEGGDVLDVPLVSGQTFSSTDPDPQIKTSAKKTVSSQQKQYWKVKKMLMYIKLRTTWNVLMCDPVTKFLYCYCCSEDPGTSSRT